MHRFEVHPRYKHRCPSATVRMARCRKKWTKWINDAYQEEKKKKKVGKRRMVIERNLVIMSTRLAMFGMITKRTGRHVALWKRLLIFFVICFCSGTTETRNVHRAVMNGRSSFARFRATTCVLVVFGGGVWSFNLVAVHEKEPKPRYS